jgi:hypothetical protein
LRRVSSECVPVLGYSSNRSVSKSNLRANLSIFAVVRAVGDTILANRGCCRMHLRAALHASSPRAGRARGRHPPLDRLPLACRSGLRARDGRAVCGGLCYQRWRREVHESAERAALIYQAEALRALRRAATSERRAALAESLSEPQHHRALPVPSAAFYEYRGKVCRVCDRRAPPPRAHRRDGPRVCALESRRLEARQRDNAVKQCRYGARKRARG